MEQIYAILIDYPIYVLRKSQTDSLQIDIFRTHLLTASIRTMPTVGTTNMESKQYHSQANKILECVVGRQISRKLQIRMGKM